MNVGDEETGDQHTVAVLERRHIEAGFVKPTYGGLKVAIGNVATNRILG